MKGAVIASDATPDKNKLSTGTLTWSDIQNNASYSASSSGVNAGWGKGTEDKNKGITPNIGVTVSGNADSTTKAAVSPGTIEVRSNPNVDLSGLSRDPAAALNALGKIFDKKSVQEKQELANLFGELAYNEVHRISEKNGWKEGSPEKIALHSLVGGIMAQLGGGSFVSGAVGAGINEAIQGELSNIKDPALHQWASALVGSIAAKVVGGDAQTGASTAVSGTRNNLYWEWINKEAALSKANVSPEKAKEIMDAFNADPSNSYNFGKDAEYKNVDELGIGAEGDVNRLNLFVNIAREKGLNEEQISSLVNTFNEQLTAGAQAHNMHIIDAGMNLGAGLVMATEVYATIEAGKIVYQMRQVSTGTVTSTANRLVGTQWENYVEGTRLAGVEAQGMLQTQQTFTVADRVTGKTITIRPDYLIWSAQEETTAIAAVGDAKAGSIVLNDQARGLMQLAANGTTSKTLIYYVPQAGAVPQTIYRAAEDYGVRVLEVVVK